MRSFIPYLVLPVILPLSARAVDFETEILPFLDAKCIECHKAPYEENGRTKKPKAGLRLDGAWAITMGSENGSVLEPGKAEESELYLRVTLPSDDDDFMPPEGKADPLTEKELALFKKWIDEGADFGGWAGNLVGKPKEVSNTGEKIPVSEVQEIYNRLGEGLEAPEEKVWAPVTEAGGRVVRLSDSSPLVAVDFRLSAEPATDEAIGSLGVIAPHIAELDLSKTAISNDALAILAETPRLVRLNLSQTPVDDGAIDHLAGLEELRYLNLYGSRVGDAGIAKLGKMKNLEAIYLWNSGVTQAGAKQLQKALPNANINFK